MIPFRFQNKMRPVRALLSAGLWAGFSMQPALAQISSFETVRDQLATSEFRLYDRNGDAVHEQRKSWNHRQMGWVPIQDVSASLKEAVILSEDRRFYQHYGVDWLALGRAAEKYILESSKKRGASTISMQVAALLDQKLKPKRTRRAWNQKIDQIFQAFELERSWSKDQILEAYLNLVSFRGELQGISSSARGLFGKVPSGLNQEESLILAALIRSPQAEEKKVVERACGLTPSLEVCSRVTQLVQRQGLLPRPFPPEISLAPHLARILMKEKKDQSTLSRSMQSRVLEILRQQVISFRDRNMNDAAALVVENKTGEVIAYVGSSGNLSTAQEVDGVRAKRQAGSTLKPFLYGLAIERRYLTASSGIDDAVTDISLGPGSVYRPMDFDKEYHGSDVTVRTALASSLNIPAVRTLQLIGVGNFVNRLGLLGFQGLRSEEFYGYSLALGTADVSLWDLVNAYRTLANQGQWSELSTSKTASPVMSQVVSKEAVFIVNDILSDSASRSLTFGLDSPMSTRYWTAAKTGTSKDMRDNWCIGFSSRYTVGVWTGNFSGEPMRNVTGVSGAAPAWAEIMDVLHETGKDLAPTPPAGVQRVQNEWYIVGTEPSPNLVKFQSKPSHHAKITYPVEGLMIARDPDIPLAHQRVFFESNSSDSSAKWILNSKYLASAAKPYAWPPGEPGGYNLQLISGSGEVLDQIRFTIRR